MTLTLAPDQLPEAARILRAGGLVAFATETVYGLGGDATSDRAVARIYEAKGRPRFNPLIVHVDSLAMAERLAIFSDLAHRVTRAFWPGPLTLVLPLRPDSGLSPFVTAELPTVALRLPAHPLARALIHAADLPLAAPSANPSGRVSPTRAAHVLDGLSGRIDAVLDGGSCAVGVESSILSLVDVPRLLRPGGAPVEALEALIGPISRARPGEKIAAPGMLASHYAPLAPLRLNARNAETGEILIGFGAVDGALNLSPGGDLVEAATNLFHLLREADKLAGPAGRIAIAALPDHGLGLALNDRLSRAATPKA